MVSQDKLTPEILTATEQSLMELPPMTEETDSVLRDYYDYAATELERIPGLTLPATLYLRRVATWAEVQQVYGHIQDVIFNAMIARGRNSLGKISPEFWTNSPVPGLLSSFQRVGRASDQAYRSFELNKP